jgi:hypothetical protein
MLHPREAFVHAGREAAASSGIAARDLPSRARKSAQKKIRFFRAKVEAIVTPLW